MRKTITLEGYYKRKVVEAPQASNPSFTQMINTKQQFKVPRV